MKVQRRRMVRRRRRSPKGRALLVLACVVLFAGVFAQVTMLSRVSSQNERASALQGEIEALSANAENLELSIHQYHNLDTIAVRARQLGMEQPDETQIRVINVPRSETGDNSTRVDGSAETQNVVN